MNVDAEILANSSGLKLPGQMGRLQHPCWKPFLLYMALGVAGVVVAVVYGALILGTIEAIPSFVLALSYGLRIAEGYPRFDAHQGIRLSEAANAIAQVTATVSPQTQVPGGIRVVRSPQRPRIAVHPGLLRTLDDTTMRGLAALIIAQVRDDRRSGLTAGFQAALLTVVAIDAIVAYSLAPSSRDARAVAVIASVGFSIWLVAAAWTAISRPWTRTMFRRSDAAAVRLTGDAVYVTRALNGIADWKDQDRRQSPLISRLVARLLQPVHPDAQERARAAGIESPTRTSA